MEIPAQNTQLSRPRKKTQNESQEQYDEYLHQFYTNKFIISITPSTSLISKYPNTISSCI